TKVLSKTLPAGNWTLTATAVIFGFSPEFANTGGFAMCQLQDASGGAIGTVASGIPNSLGDTFQGFANLNLNGGAVIPAAGGEVSLWCGGTNLAAITMSSAQMLAMQVGGFF